MAKKRAKNGRFFGPGGSNFDPFFTIFCKSLLNMPKNIISKNKKKSLSEKCPSPKNCKNGEIRAKMAVFRPSRPEFCENQKNAWTFSYFYPREAVYQISENLAHQTWRKCVTNG